MGKHETGYARVERDLYPTPHWVVSDALAKHVDLRGLTVWEPACGDGRMAAALRLQGCGRVYTSDIVDRDTGQDEVLDFLSAQTPELARFDMSVTNPPFGQVDSDTAARDGAVVASIALQYGVPLEVIRHAVMRNRDGSACGPLGAALDRIAAEDER